MATFLSFRDGGKTSEEGIARFVRQMNNNEGVVDEGDMKVSVRAAGANKSVDIATGDVLISEGNYSYIGWSDAVDNETVTDNASGNPRIDAVSVYIDKSVVSTASNDNPNALLFKVTAGTAGASPTAPADADIQTDIGAGNPFHRLADVDVANGFTTINDVEIEDRRQWNVPTDAVRRDYDTNPERIISGLLVAVPGSGLTASVSAGSGYVRGFYVRKDQVEDHLFVDGEDAYVDIDKTGAFSYDSGTTPYAEPAVATDSIRLCKVTASGGNVTSVTDLRNMYARGLVTASSNLTLTTAFQTVVGSSITFEVSQISYMDIQYQAHFDGGGGTASSNVGDDIIAHMDLDGTDLDGGATGHTTHEVSLTNTTEIMNGTIGTSLTAAAHTLILEAKNNTGARGEIEAAGTMTGYTYQIYPGIGASV